MPEGSFRLSIIALLCGLVCVTGSHAAHAQFFFGFGAPQQINTARGAIQLAPGWHVANAPVRTNGGYRVAVRSETGEQRNMLIGANGALAITRPSEPRAMRAPARPLPQASRPAEPKKPKVALAAAPAAPKAPATKRTPAIQPASAPSESVKPQPRATTPDDTQLKARPPAPLDVQAPGFAHGVPINPLD